MDTQRMFPDLFSIVPPEGPLETLDTLPRAGG
jgi:hypothetical protein